jgi:hypothetical protein
MRAAHAESPFEESAADAGYSADAMAVEAPSGVHLEATPLPAEMPAPLGGDLQPLEMPSGLPLLSMPQFPATSAQDVFAASPAEPEPAGTASEAGGERSPKDKPNVTKLEKWLAKMKAEEGNV